MLQKTLIIAVLGYALIVSGCAFHSTAKDWNGLSGADGKKTYYKTTTKVAFNLLVMVPFLGDLSIDGMVDDLTKEIAESNGDFVRIVQGSSENYWYGFPPFTWIVTPIVSTVAAEYQPDQQTYDKDQQEIRNSEKNETLNPTKW